MAEQLWTILSTIDGRVLAPTFTTNGAGQHPKDAGFAWDGATMRATRLTKRPDLSCQIWSGTEWVDDPVCIEAQLVAEVKSTAEQMKMKVLTTGGAKKMVYNAQADEVKEYRLLSNALGATVASVWTLISGLPIAERQRKFRYSLAAAAKRGEPNISKAIARFEAGADKANGEVSRIEAIEQEAVDAIKLATSAAAKRSAYAAINWTWKPA